jgi:hypothetical protein
MLVNTQSRRIFSGTTGAVTGPWPAPRLTGTTTESDWAGVRSAMLLHTRLSGFTGRGAVSLSSFGGEGQGEEAVVLNQPAR